MKWIAPILLITVAHAETVRLTCDIDDKTYIVDLESTTNGSEWMSRSSDIVCDFTINQDEPLACYRAFAVGYPPGYERSGPSNIYCYAPVCHE